MDQTLADLLKYISYSGARNSDTLLLPAGHLRRKVLCAVGESNHRKCLRCTFFPFGFIDFRVQRRQFRVF